MSKLAKQFVRMEALEAELLESLTIALADTASGKNDLIFLSSRVRPANFPKSCRSATADELTLLADDLISLYQQLGVSAEATPAARYLAACSSCYNYSDHHRAAPQGLAARLLAELKEGRH